MFESAACSTASGWAFDPDYTGSIDVHLYIDGPAGAPGITAVGVTANQSRPDVGAAYPGHTNSGWTWTIPESLKNGVTHTIYPYGIDRLPNGALGGNNPLLSGSPKSFTCAVPPTGTFTYTCGYPNATGSGTATDPQGTPVNIAIYDGPSGSGGVQIGTGNATPSYSISIPGISDGQTHQLYAYGKDIPSGTWYQIGSTVAASCAPTITLSASPTTVTQGETSTLAWSTTNATTCTASGGDASWPGSRPTNGSYISNPIFATTTYTLQCVNAAGVQTTQSVTVAVNTVPPIVSISRVDPPDYCTSGPGEIMTVQYTSPVGLAQKQWQMQVATDAGFSTIVYDSGVQMGAVAVPRHLGVIDRITSFVRMLVYRMLSPDASAAILNATYTHSTAPGALAFGHTYWMRTKSWDTADTPSAWSSAVSFSTPPGPFPQPNFTMDPAQPTAKQPVTFTDTSNYQGASPATLQWDFGDGSAPSSENPATHTYTSDSPVSVTLRVSSSNSGSEFCSVTKSVSVQKAIPQYREVRPGQTSPTP